MGNALTSPLSSRRPGRRFGASTRFPGIVNDARALGVTVTHLRYCLTGQRTSKSLMARYQKLQADKRFTADVDQIAQPSS